MAVEEVKDCPLSSKMICHSERSEASLFVFVHRIDQEEFLAALGKTGYALYE